MRACQSPPEQTVVHSLALHTIIYAWACFGIFTIGLIAYNVGQYFNTKAVTMQARAKQETAGAATQQIAIGLDANRCHKMECQCLRKALDGERERRESVERQLTEHIRTTDIRLSLLEQTIKNLKK
ncbi:hypothetical protein F5Y04DRAFT_278784 [Hypomontagnella monticulosa]|nr:hypothetical protein F5Y04DRAFT_278784 [Hypomontagnella monticulosa]